ncbi:hypothetical protein [Streptomyces sp. HPF1205]|uniref:hypothetical protein n=1 Tax=Streptomyces sp. HPF1205 TaxID=2873262 RepID=UPI001CEDDDAA|nr:hypothetical protein [Streptomyces sp. HPF1205]
MGYSVLYIAFGIVALWLLGEVLLQHKARLRWRLLAFAGFLGVVGGVALREVVLIMLGAAAFGTGQTFVTLSYKRGFSAGWALRGGIGALRLGRRTSAAYPSAEPTLAVTPVEESHEDAVGEGRDLLAERDDATAVYQPVPMHDDSGEYPLYDGNSSYTPDPYTSGGYEGYGAHGYAGWGAEPQPAPATASYDGYDPGYAQDGWGGQAYGYAQDGYGQGGNGQGGYGQGAHAEGGHGQDGYGQDGHGQAGYEQAGHQEQPAAGGYDTGGYHYGGYDGGYGSGQWPVQEHQEHQEPYPGARGGAGYDPQAQPYIPQQQHQPAYEQAGAQEPPQPQYTADHDPYDPYRY